MSPRRYRFSPHNEPETSRGRSRNVITFHFLLRDIAILEELHFSAPYCTYLSSHLEFPLSESGSRLRALTYTPISGDLQESPSYCRIFSDCCCVIFILLKGLIVN